MSFDRFTGYWKGRDEPVVISFRFQVGGYGRFWSVDPVWIDNRIRTMQ